jgi:hypothetical protein
MSILLDLGVRLRDVATLQSRIAVQFIALLSIRSLSISNSPPFDLVTVTRDPSSVGEVKLTN